ncbi:transcriptional regulator, LacI family [Candidatus Koribacter versatilis Ellin345]|uniref:Transcriptional regulator, LacI family n=1 Tax=Koribacter versatilis (strain Ellin345) TaxID=204669 RepID=Q1IR12_KORVE|nr:LacI family DNA-binding transcriptional regulator [Candidatus Koribacter versatilis]ABF40688.1 transcriptional regulator, LacI family [Candidatus Koribacter versatilis Ellin345]
MAPRKKLSDSGGPPRVTLKTIAEKLGLTAGTVSAALNNSPAARSIPDATKERILRTARELGYSPNYFARSLRLQRAYTVGVIAEEIGDPYGGMVISGIEEYLRKNNYFFLAVSHRHDQEILHTYAKMLMTRGVEGFITTDTSLLSDPGLPTVAVSGHRQVSGVTNVVIDHHVAARLALQHLVELGHTRIAFLIGDPASSDSKTRWSAICEVAAELRLTIYPELTVQIESRDSTPGLGYPFAKQLLERRVPFTALFAYNDLSAIGSIWAFREAGIRVPEDISVVGFDDIPFSAYTHPGLTTIRQPLKQMGMIAAQTVVDQIEGKSEYVPEIVVEPELVVRSSTAPVSAHNRVVTQMSHASD